MKMKKIIAITIACLLVLGIFAGVASATDKEEVVYVNLTTSGDVKDVYVVNIFEVEEPKYLVDYGEYKSVRNLVTPVPIEQNGDENVVYVADGRFFYQGDLGATEIPWDINISFFLDGKYIKPEDIAGKSGHVTIVLDIGKNENFKDTYFYKRLGVQATVLLNATNCVNINAPGAVIANNGKNKQLSYTILPNKGGVYNIGFDATDFEMPAITINGVILNMNIDVDLSEAKSMMRTLGSGTAALNSGAKELNSGAQTLAAGVGLFNLGIETSQFWFNQIVNEVGEEVFKLSDTYNKSGFNNNNFDTVINEIIAKDPSKKEQLEKYQGIKPYIISYNAELSKTTTQLSEGASKLSNGTSSLYSGTKRLASSTSNLDGTVQSMVDKILEPITGGDGYIRSFTSVKNVDIKSIQFVMHTDPIEMTKEEKVEKEKRDLNLIERILKIFGLYKEEE